MAGVEYRVFYFHNNPPPLPPVAMWGGGGLNVLIQEPYIKNEPNFSKYGEKTSYLLLKVLWLVEKIYLFGSNFCVF
jgi:hypothetical protein